MMEAQESVLLHVWLVVCIVTLFLSESQEKRGSESGAPTTGQWECPKRRIQFDEGD